MPLKLVLEFVGHAVGGDQDLVSPFPFALGSFGRFRL